MTQSHAKQMKIKILMLMAVAGESGFCELGLRGTNRPVATWGQAVAGCLLCVSFKPIATAQYKIHYKNNSNMGAPSSGTAAELLQFLDEQHPSVVDSVVSQLQLQGVMDAGMGLYSTSAAAPISLQVLAVSSLLAAHPTGGGC